MTERGFGRALSWPAPYPRVQREEAMARKKGPSRAERWESATAAAREALESLRELQEEYQDWRDNLPENLDASPTAELLDEVLAVDIDGALATLDEADNLILPLGFGRD